MAVIGQLAVSEATLQMAPRLRVTPAEPPHQTPFMVISSGFHLRAAIVHISQQNLLRPPGIFLHRLQQGMMTATNIPNQPMAWR